MNVLVLKRECKGSGFIPVIKIIAIKIRDEAPEGPMKTLRV